MFCRKCGTQMGEEAKFCPKCGEKSVQNPTPDINPAMNGNPIPAANQGNAQMPATGPNKNYTKIGLIAVGAAAVVILILGIILFGGSGYKSKVTKLVKSIEQADGDQMLKLFPEEILELEFSYYSRSEIKKEFQNYVDRRLEKYEDEYGDNIKIKYKIEDKEALDYDEIVEANEELEENDIDATLSKGYELTLKLNISGRDGSGTETMKVYAVKIDSKWYVTAF